MKLQSFENNDYEIIKKQFLVKNQRSNNFFFPGDKKFSIQRLCHFSKTFLMCKKFLTTFSVLFKKKKKKKSNI